MKIFCKCVDKSDINLNSNHRFELELKYTRMVDIHSRPTLPRVDMHHVVHHLNKVEEGTKGNEDDDNDNEDDIVKASPVDVSDVIGVDCNVSKSRYVWHADSITTDSGPIDDDDDDDDEDNNNNDTAATANVHESIVDMDIKKKKNGNDDIHLNDSNRNNIKNNNSKNKKRLTKAERYDHPYERQVYPSKISYMEFEQII